MTSQRWFLTTSVADQNKEAKPEPDLTLKKKKPKSDPTKLFCCPRFIKRSKYIRHKNLLKKKIDGIISGD